MIRARAYSIEFANVAVTDVQDLFGLYTTSGVPIEFFGFVLGQVTATAVGNLNISIKRITGVTDGSGGTTPTPNPMLGGDSAAVTVAHVNDTTQSTGTVKVLHADIFNVLNGYQFFFPPHMIPLIGVSSGVIVSLNTAPGSSESMSGTAYFGELS